MDDYQKELMRYRIQTAKEKFHSAKVLAEAGAYKDSIGRSYPLTHVTKTFGFSQSFFIVKIKKRYLKP